MRMEFNVLCETRGRKYHLAPQSSTAVVVDDQVCYRNNWYKFRGYSTGLDGQAIVLVLGDELVLYTDTLTEKAEDTVEQLHERACRTMQWARQKEKQGF